MNKENQTPEELQAKLASDKIFRIGTGIVFRVVCSPASKTDQEISDHVSKESPPGTSAGRWEVSSGNALKNHKQWAEETRSLTARVQCPDCADRVHVLMNC